MTTSPPIIVWFRDDLRLSDHPALHAAARAGAPVIGLYVQDEANSALRRSASCTRPCPRRSRYGLRWTPRLR